MNARTGMRTPLSRVEGLGSARAGTTHFLHQRISAVALAFLSIWFVWSALGVVGGGLAETLVFLTDPVSAVLMALFLATALYHMSLGLHIIIEDYIHQEGLKMALLILNRFFMWGIGAAAGFALLKIAL